MIISVTAVSKITLCGSDGLVAVMVRKKEMSSSRAIKSLVMDRLVKQTDVSSGDSVKLDGISDGK